MDIGCIWCRYIGRWGSGAQAPKQILCVARVDDGAVRETVGGSSSGRNEVWREIDRIVQCQYS
jgi:hypothetical protein